MESGGREDETERTRTVTEAVEGLQRQPMTTRKGLRTKGLPKGGEGLRIVATVVAVTVLLMTATLLTTATAKGRIDDDGMRTKRRGGVGSVALLLPHHTQGDNSARNPTVGIAALRIVPGRARGLVKLRGNPPIPRAARNGLTEGKGTPRITDLFLPGGVRLVMRILILLLVSPSPSVAGVVGRVTSTSSTRGGPPEVEGSTRRRAGRRGLRDSVRRRQDIPHTLNAPVGVTVEVTIPVANHTTTTMLVTATTMTVVGTPAGARGVGQGQRAPGRVGGGLPSGRTDPVVRVAAQESSVG